MPDCSNLRRRGVECEPFCDYELNEVTPRDDDDGSGGLSSSSSSSSSSVPIWLIVAIVLGMTLVAAVVFVAVQRARRSSARQEEHDAPHAQQTMTMFMNPVHPGFACSSIGADHVDDDFQEPPRPDVTLDSELYVQLANRPNAGDATYEAPYSILQTPADTQNDNGDNYESVI